MARFVGGRDLEATFAAARKWVDSCLVADGSVFSNGALWTGKNIQVVASRTEEAKGDGDYFEKLALQLSDAEPALHQLMAEILWALYLFPSKHNITVKTKREHILEIWGNSGARLDPAHPLLTEQVLDGVGSAGQAFLAHRPKEVAFLLRLAQHAKSLKPADRAAAFSDYDRFLALVESVPEDGNRQFRHMLRYFLFPDRVERMSSNGEREKVLAGYKIASKKELETWTDRQLDESLFALRKKLESEHGKEQLDFYAEPLRARWKVDEEPLEAPPSESKAFELDDVERSVTTAPARNLILYGPPGTGKTWTLQKEFFPLYTDQPVDLDRSTWEQDLVSAFGWRAVAAATLSLLGKASKVGDIADHPLVTAKARELGRTTSVVPTLWGTLQQHTPEDVKTVKYAARRSPYLFTKSAASEWSLLPDWAEEEEEGRTLARRFSAGPQAAAAPVERFRVVTFHPSYSYEDFVVGLRPVEGEDGRTSFAMVDGVLKQICAQARANPRKRYALFIDEINRANIAKVFGELIMLIEPDKRARYSEDGRLQAGMEVQLPGGSDARFGVPANLDIYGTMNTADRSIALLDIALRRRFEFREIPPSYDVLDREVDGVHLGDLLRLLNDRLEFLADRERRIGHAYFFKIETLQNLRDTFRHRIIPLLQEYFFDDWKNVERVLSAPDGASPLIRREVLQGAALFAGKSDIEREERTRYLLTDDDAWTANAFRSLYESAASPVQAAIAR